MIDVSYPQFSGTLEERVEQMAHYIEELHKALELLMSNIDISNLNADLAAKIEAGSTAQGGSADAESLEELKARFDAQIGDHILQKDVPSTAKLTDTVYIDTDVRNLISALTTRMNDAENDIENIGYFSTSILNSGYFRTLYQYLT